MSALDKYKNLKIVLGFPSNGRWVGDFGISALNMSAYFMANKVGEYKSQVLVPAHTKGSILPRSRLNIVKMAFEKEATHVAMIDTDQTYPRHTLHDLVLADKDIIGCNIATKEIPASPTARKKGSDLGGDLVYTDPDSPRFEKVWRLGCGIMLIKMKVFQKLGLNCWEILWKEELQDYQGEDWRFCELAEAAGFEIWVDHKLSDEVGHVGDYNFKHDVVGEKIKEAA